MKARLFCRTGELSGADYEVSEGATIGRHPDNEIVLSVDSISNRHARIAFDAERRCFFLERLDHRADTRLDGLVVEQRVRLEDLHIITLGGKHEFIFSRLEKPADPGTETLAGRLGRIEVPSFLSGPCPPSGAAPRPFKKRASRTPPRRGRFRQNGTRSSYPPFPPAGSRRRLKRRYGRLQRSRESLCSLCFSRSGLAIRR